MDPEKLIYGYPNASGIPFSGVFGDLALKVNIEVIIVLAQSQCTNYVKYSTYSLHQLANPLMFIMIVKES